MGTSFTDVYAAAMTRIIDPDLAGLSKRNIFLYLDKMYNYMLEGIVYFIVPSSIIYTLSDRTEPFEGSQDFESDSGQYSYFIISETPPLISSIIQVTLDGEPLEFIYDFDTNSIVLNAPPPSSGAIKVVWYEPGSFNSALTQRNISIMGAWMAYVWALAQSNNELDINRLLLDGDFRMASEGSVIPAKTSWVNQYREQAERLMTSNDWANSFITSRTDRRPKVGY